MDTCNVRICVYIYVCVCACMCVCIYVYAYKLVKYIRFYGVIVNIHNKMKRMGVYKCVFASERYVCMPNLM